MKGLNAFINSLQTAIHQMKRTSLKTSSIGKIKQIAAVFSLPLR